MNLSPKKSSSRYSARHKTACSHCFCRSYKATERNNSGMNLLNISAPKKYREYKSSGSDRQSCSTEVVSPRSNQSKTSSKSDESDDEQDQQNLNKEFESYWRKADRIRSKLKYPAEWTPMLSAIITATNGNVKKARKFIRIGFTNFVINMTSTEKARVGKQEK